MNKYLSSSLALSALTLAVSAPAQAAGFTTLSQGFENVSALAPAWGFTNNSSPAPFVPPAAWAQGNPATGNFVAQAGATTSFAQVDGNSSAGNNTQENGQVSNWLLTPELDFSQGGSFSFFARSFGGNSKGELIEVRQSNAGTSSNVGTTAQSFGDFTTLVGTAGDLDPFGATPLPGTSWGAYSFNIAATGGSGRLAFRYFATNGGVNGTEAQYAAIDTVDYKAVPEPSSMAGMLLIGGLGAAYRRNKSKKAQA
jgi:hypothetical protein